MNLKISRQIFPRNIPMSHFMKIRSEEAQLFHEDTHTHNEADICFPQFRETP